MYKIGLALPMVFEGSVLEGIEYAARLGVEGIEFFDWEAIDVDAVGTAAAEHGIDVSATVAAGAGGTIMDLDAPALARPESHDEAVADIERSVTAAVGLGCETLIVTVGQNDDTLDDATQWTAIVEVLKDVAPVAETHDVTIVVEPLNTRVDHPGYFLTRTDAAVALVEAVNSSAVKVLFDIYHQQVTEGDVLRRLTRQIEHVGHIHVADTPGRHEPETGELAYDRILESVAGLAYDGYVTGEFTPLAASDDAVETFVRTARNARAAADCSVE